MSVDCQSSNEGDWRRITSRSAFWRSPFLPFVGGFLAGHDSAAWSHVRRSFPRFLQGRELVAKLFSERTQLRMENEQTAQPLTGSINASLNVADGEIRPGGDFADFKRAIRAEQQYLPIPVIQRSDQEHQVGADFRKDQRVERTRFVLGQESYSRFLRGGNWSRNSSRSQLHRESQCSKPINFPRAL